MFGVPWGPHFEDLLVVLGCVEAPIANDVLYELLIILCREGGLGVDGRPRPWVPDP